MVQRENTTSARVERDCGAREQRAKHCQYRLVRRIQNKSHFFYTLLLPQNPTSLRINFLKFDKVSVVEGVK